MKSKIELIISRRLNELNRINEEISDIWKRIMENDITDPENERLEIQIEFLKGRISGIKNVVADLEQLLESE